MLDKATVQEVKKRVLDLARHENDRLRDPDLANRVYVAGRRDALDDIVAMLYCMAEEETAT